MKTMGVETTYKAAALEKKYEQLVSSGKFCLPQTKKCFLLMQYRSYQGRYLCRICRAQSYQWRCQERDQRRGQRWFQGCLQQRRRSCWGRYVDRRRRRAGGLSLHLLTRYFGQVDLNSISHFLYRSASAESVTSLLPFISFYSNSDRGK